MGLGGYGKAPSLFELQQIPAGDRGPRLRAMIAFCEARIEGAKPRMQSQYRSSIRKAVEVGRLVGIVNLNEP